MTFTTLFTDGLESNLVMPVKLAVIWIYAPVKNKSPKPIIRERKKK